MVIILDTVVEGQGSLGMQKDLVIDTLPPYVLGVASSKRNGKSRLIVLALSAISRTSIASGLWQHRTGASDVPGGVFFMGKVDYANRMESSLTQTTYETTSHLCYRGIRGRRGDRHHGDLRLSRRRLGRYRFAGRYR